MIASEATPPLGTAVEVEWVDSVTRGRWIPRTEAEQWARGQAPSARHCSVGYLLARTDAALCLVQSMVKYDADGSDEMVAEVLSIPLPAVLSVRQLR